MPDGTPDNLSPDHRAESVTERASEHERAAVAGRMFASYDHIMALQTAENLHPDTVTEAYNDLRAALLDLDIDENRLFDNLMGNTEARRYFRTWEFDSVEEFLENAQEELCGEYTRLVKGMRHYIKFYRHPDVSIKRANIPPSLNRTLIYFDIDAIEAQCDRTEFVLKLLRQSFRLIKRHFSDVRRKTGEPFTRHLVNVPYLEFHLQQLMLFDRFSHAEPLLAVRVLDQLVAGLLHDVAEDTDAFNYRINMPDDANAHTMGAEQHYLITEFEPVTGKPIRLDGRPLDSAELSGKPHRYLKTLDLVTDFLKAHPTQRPVDIASDENGIYITDQALFDNQDFRVCLKNGEAEDEQHFALRRQGERFYIVRFSKALSLTPFIAEYLVALTNDESQVAAKEARLHERYPRIDHRQARQFAKSSAQVDQILAAADQIRSTVYRGRERSAAQGDIARIAAIREVPKRRPSNGERLPGEKLFDIYPVIDNDGARPDQTVHATRRSASQMPRGRVRWASIGPPWSPASERYADGVDNAVVSPEGTSAKLVADGAGNTVIAFDDDKSGKLAALIQSHIFKLADLHFIMQRTLDDYNPDLKMTYPDFFIKYLMILAVDQDNAEVFAVKRALEEAHDYGDAPKLAAFRDAVEYVYAGLRTRYAPAPSS